MPPSSSSRFVRLRRLHTLSLRLALRVGAILAVAAAVAGLAGWVTWPVAAGAVLVAVGAAYGVAQHLLAARIELARNVLKQTRKHHFENLAMARIQRGDELNGLIWQVYRTGQTLEKEIRELKKIENYRREFIGDISHELKTPIFAVQGFAETLLDGALEDERVRRSFVEKILRNAGRLNNLVRDLGEITKIETGELEMVKKPFDLHRLAVEVIESMEPIAEAKSIALSYRVPAGLPLVVGDRDRLQQVLINLVDNAVKYNNAGGHVELTARRLPTGRVKVSVADDGIGIAPQHIPRLTERFYRVDKSRSRQQGGTGLGLAIVKHIVSAHDGELVVDSHPGRGSTFGFTLRAVAAEANGQG